VDTAVHSSKKRRTTSSAPTVEDIIHDSLTPICNEYWAPGNKEQKPYDPQVIEDIYSKELKDADPTSTKIQILEFSSYLEK
jgi:hypothetical protein